MTATARTVLVVDDEKIVREALRKQLVREHYVVHLASSGEEGLAILQAQPVQLVISDKSMPGMSGLEFLNLVRDRYPRVCRVMLTGDADLPSVLEAINRGEVYRFLQKPWNWEHLLITLHFAFESLELEAENRKLQDDLRRQMNTLSRLHDQELIYARDLQTERLRSDELLLNVLPRTVAARLKAGEKVIADRVEDATVMFSDLVRFTQLSAGLPAADVVSMLNACFSAFDALADAHGVEKIKTLGDGYLAAAGLLEKSQDHTQAMAEMALGMQRALGHVNHQRGSDLQMRIGLHRGPVVAGVIGLTRFSYDVWGDTVNTASRMESSGVAGRVHVTEAVFQSLESRYEFEAREPLEIKGKGLMRTWFLLGRKG